MLDDRKLRVLYAIIQSYISTAEPVASRTLTKSYDFGLSSATIRNEMSDLEDLGYLNKAHTSSGRIPSDKAYRFYVDDLLSQNLRVDQTMFDPPILRDRDLKSALQRALALVSEKTHYTTVLLTGNFDSVILKRIDLIPLSAKLFVMVLIFNTGDVKNAMVHHEGDLDEDWLEKVEVYLNDLLSNRTAASIIRLSETLSSSSEEWIIKEILPLIVHEIETLLEVEIEYDGLSYIFNYPEYKDFDRAKDFVRLLEDKDLLRDTFLKDNSKGISVTIGEENSSQRLAENAVITASYDDGDRFLGRLAVIGPRRMEYRKALETVVALYQWFDHKGRWEERSGE